MPVLPMSAAQLASSVASILLQRGIAFEAKHYAYRATGAGGLRASNRVELEKDLGPFVCCGVSASGAAVASGEGESMQIQADGRFITIPQFCDVTVIANFPGNANDSGGQWPAPIFANASMRVLVEATADPDGDPGLLSGFHTTQVGADAIRAAFGELRAFTLTLDSAANQASRASLDITERVRLTRLFRTGSEAVVDSLKIRVGQRDLVSMQGDGLAHTSVYGPLGNGAESVVMADIENETVEAILKPGASSPLAYLTFLGAAL